MHNVYIIKMINKRKWYQFLSPFITKRIKNTPRVYYYEYYLKLRNQNTKKVIKKKIQIIESTTLARKSDLQIAKS